MDKKLDIIIEKLDGIHQELIKVNLRAEAQMKVQMPLSGQAGFIMNNVMDLLKEVGVKPEDIPLMDMGGRKDVR